MPGAALPRLLQLASPALPVGGYSYSQGLEYAVASALVTDETSALRWIGDVLDLSLSRYEAPLLARAHSAWSDTDLAHVSALNDDWLASRESAELRAETIQMGYSLRRLLHEMGDIDTRLLADLDQLGDIGFPLVWAAVAQHWSIPVAISLNVYLWAWLENQTMAALKTVPLGQACGQRLLFAIGARIPALVERALDLDDTHWSNFAPGHGLASIAHETQYSRLFRS
ncbi:urease accessory protein UreF [Pseudolysobacter antarcticus]|uniref:Urease accessory protein UreF n=1 Tax=Pseudolysobacter antarcticus TaxID=2511995 RepID=A0A411HQA2_9GAMM|nr:urease accessory protein UreF [Pseudolysobacter antarcticus]